MRRSSFARWRPNVRARARRSARRPSATRSPRCARSSASRSSRSATSSPPSAIAVGSEPLPDRDEHGAERLVRVADLGHRGRSPSSTSPTPRPGRAAPPGRGPARAAGRVRARPRSSPGRRSGCRRDRRRSSCRSATPRRRPASRSTSARSSSGIAFQKLCSKNHSPCRISSTTRGRLERISSVCQSSVISSASALLDPPAAPRAACPRRRGGRGARRSAGAPRARCGASPRSDGR